MKVGKYTYGHTGDTHEPLRGGNVFIGNFCSLGPGLKIYTGKGGHRTEFVSTYPFGFIYEKEFPNDPRKLLLEEQGHVYLGNDIWTGANVTIMPKVIIGDGAVIANNSHVIRDVEPYALVGGNPAKLIKYRFDCETIRKLKKIKWWNWDDEKIKQNISLISSPNIDKFVEKFYY